MPGPVSRTEKLVLPPVAPVVRQEGTGLRATGRIRCPDGLTQRAPWPVSGSFGLLHGLGFAGALAEVGLPSAEIPLDRGTVQGERFAPALERQTPAHRIADKHYRIPPTPFRRRVWNKRDIP